MQRLPFFRCFHALSIFLCFILPCTLHAGAAPDAGTIERTLPKPPKTLPQEFEKPPTDEKEVIDVGPKILIKDFDFIGNEVITSEALSMLVAPYKNKNLSMTDLENIRLLIGDYYRQQGFWASVIYGDQDFADNILVVDIFEAKVGSILHESDDEPRFPRERIIAFIERNQDQGQPIKIKELDYSIQDLNSVAGIFSSMTLKPGTEVGESDIVVQTTNTTYFSGSLLVDNHGSRSTGYERGLLMLDVNSPFKLGEKFNFMYLATTEINYWGAGISYPLFNDSTKISYNYTTLDYDLGAPYGSLNGYGDSETHSGAITRNLWRQGSFQLSGTGSYAYRTYYNFASGAETSDKNIKAWTATLDAAFQDSFASGGINIASLATIIGRLDLSGTPSDYSADSTTAKTNGSFEKLSASYIRIQRITDKDSLWLTLTGQYAFDNNLDSAEKMSLGGATGVRAYPTSEANGDHGLMIQAEVRHAFNPFFTVKAFYDWGQIYQYANTWTNWNSSSGTPNKYQLKGAGMGILYQAFETVSVDAMIATKIGNNKGEDSSSKDNDGTDWGTRGWVSITKTF